VNLIGDLAQTLYELAGSRSYPSVADGFYMLFYPLMLAGLLRFPTARPRLAARVRLALDLAVVAIGASTVVVYVVLGPFALAGAAQPACDPATDVVGDRDPPRASWAPYVAVAVGFGLLLVDLRNDPLLPDGFLVIAAVLLATLVSIRQFLAQRDLLRTQGQLSYQSLHDQLTGLPNRALIIDRADQLARPRAPEPHAGGCAVRGHRRLQAHQRRFRSRRRRPAATRCGHAAVGSPA
jgi:hypothetical protein